MACRMASWVNWLPVVHCWRAGYKNPIKEVQFLNSKGRPFRADWVAQEADGNWIAFDAKTGPGFEISDNQKLGYPELQKGGAVLNSDKLSQYGLLTPSSKWKFSWISGVVRYAIHRARIARRPRSASCEVGLGVAAGRTSWALHKVNFFGHILSGVAGRVRRGGWILVDPANGLSAAFGDRPAGAAIPGVTSESLPRDHRPQSRYSSV